LADKSYSALKGADALVIATEWSEFREPDFARMRKLMKTPVIFDGRNIYSPDQMKAQGFTYYSVAVMAGIKGKLTDPLLSVVMPVYNERDTIEGMIARVLAVPNLRIELVVVDDGSKDGTSDILRGLQSKYPFKLLQKPNGGKGSALRLGFKEVTGDPGRDSGTPIPSTRGEFPELSSSSARAGLTSSTDRGFYGRHRVFLFTHYPRQSLLSRF
jgi:hypothetical protein